MANFSVKNQNDMIIELLEITPEQAKEYIDGQLANRKLDKKRVKQYLNLMRNGGWHPEASIVYVDIETGKMMDAQHRMMAVVAFG